MRKRLTAVLSDGARLTNSIVYMTEVTTQNQEQKQYIRMTENDFKGRYNMHINNFLIIQIMKTPCLCPSRTEKG